ncbi:MAG: nucleoside triphosphate pyrophosphohydrolase family protein [Candidatus Woesearchaeota archaeon]
MEFNDYQRAAKTTARYPKERALHYLAPFIAGEAGELAGRYAKIVRTDYGDEDPQEIIEGDESLKTYFIKELGDILWGVALLADEIGVELDDVARINLEKLKSRAERGVIKGSGDDR